MTETWMNELTLDMLPDGICRDIAEEVGVDGLLKLSMRIGGETLYIPQMKGILRTLRDQKIREEFNGYNTADLARKYDVSQRWVQQIVNQAEH